MGRWGWGDIGARPLLFPAGMAVVGAWWGGLSAGPALPCLGAAVLLALSSWALSPRPGAHLLLLVACGLSAAGLARLQRPPPDPWVPPERDWVRLRGRVESAAAQGDGASFELTVTERLDPPTPVALRARLFCHGQGAVPVRGQAVQLSTRLHRVEPPSNPGEWDGAQLLLRRGVQWAGTLPCDGIVPLSPPSAGWSWLARVQTALGQRAHALAPRPEAAAFYLTLAAGLRAELGTEWEQRFSRSGLAHLLSVSGLHVAALALMVLLVLRTGAVWLWPTARHRDARRWAALGAIPWVWAYVVFTGNQPPAVRSAVMASAVFAGLAMGARADPLNSLSLALLLLVAWDPSSVADLSLQLSVLAVLSLLVVSPAVAALFPEHGPPTEEAPRWRRWLFQGRAALYQSLSTSGAVTCASVPLVAASFHQVSIAGVGTNLVCLPLGGLLTLLSAGGALAFVIWPPLATPLIWAGTRLSLVFLWVAARTSAMPAAVIPMPEMPGWLGAVYLLALATWALGEGRVRWLGLLAPAVLACTLLGPWIHPAPGLRVTFFAVGHGDAILLESGAHAALVDGGGEAGSRVGERHVLPALKALGIHRLELAVLSHPHADHALGLAEVLEQLPVDRVWISAGLEQEGLARKVVRAAGSAQVESAQRGRAPLALGQAVLEVEWPPGPGDHDAEALSGINDRSIVVRVRHGDVQILLTGDIEAPVEPRLPSDRTDLLKAPHHGSATSSSPELLARLRPRYVVFCVGQGGRFHFPHPDVEARYQAAGIRCLRTDRDGAIQLTSDGHDVDVRTYRHLLPEGVTTGWLPLDGGRATL